MQRWIGKSRYCLSSCRFCSALVDLLWVVGVKSNYNLVAPDKTIMNNVGKSLLFPHKNACSWQFLPVPIIQVYKSMLKCGKLSLWLFIWSYSTKIKKWTTKKHKNENCSQVIMSHPNTFPYVSLFHPSRWALTGIKVNVYWRINTGLRKFNWNPSPIPGFESKVFHVNTELWAKSGEWWLSKICATQTLPHGIADGPVSRKTVHMIHILGKSVINVCEQERFWLAFSSVTSEKPLIVPLKQLWTLNNP